MICLSTLKSSWTGQRKIRLVLQTKTTDEYMPHIMLTEHEFITGKRYIMRRDIKLSIASYDCQYSWYQQYNTYSMLRNTIILSYT